MRLARRTAVTVQLNELYWLRLRTKKLNKRASTTHTVETYASDVISYHLHKLYTWGHITYDFHLWKPFQRLPLTCIRAKVH